MPEEEEDPHAAAVAELAALNLGGLHRSNATSSKGYSGSGSGVSGSGAAGSTTGGSSSTSQGAASSTLTTTQTSSTQTYGSSYTATGTGCDLSRKDSKGVSICSSNRDSAEWRNHVVSPPSSPIDPKK